MNNDFDSQRDDLEELLKKYRPKWQLSALAWMDYDDVCQIILETNYKNISELEKDKEVFDKLEDNRNNIITKLGENIIIRRFEVIDIRDAYISGYTHNGKIGAFVVLANEDAEIAKDICMQIVASNPLALDESSIDQTILDNEKDIYKAELDKIDKKDDIKRNILELIIALNFNLKYKNKQISLYLIKITSHEKKLHISFYRIIIKCCTYFCTNDSFNNT